MSQITPEFLFNLGFNKRTKTKPLHFENVEMWDFQWNELRVHVCIYSRQIEHITRITFNAHRMMGEGNLRYDKSIIYHETIDNTTQALVSTLYKSIADYSRALLQWNLRRLLATEEEPR